MQIVELRDGGGSEMDVRLDLGELVDGSISLGLEKGQLFGDECSRFSVGELCVKVGES